MSAADPMNFATADIQSDRLQSEQAHQLLKALADPLRLQVIVALGGGLDPGQRSRAVRHRRGAAGGWWLPDRMTSLV